MSLYKKTLSKNQFINDVKILLILEISFIFTYNCTKEKINKSA